jgi:hypothetical protein
VTALDLQRGVLDPEPGMQRSARVDEQRVIVYFRRPNEMYGERDVGCAHSPDMEVVYARDAGESGEMRLDG